MDCKDLQALLHRYVDDELPSDARREAEAHIDQCDGCRRLVQQEMAWKQAIRRAATYYIAPDEVRQRIAQMTNPAKHKKPVVAAPRWSGWAMAASLLLAVALSSGATAYFVAPPLEEPLAQALVASHVRSLMADHLTDVASSDQHTVKPWFHGRLDYAPPVDDLAAAGFPLVGGRLDYVDHRSVAALVYRHDKHPINLFVFPSGEPDGVARAETANGYNILHWTAGGMAFWAVSDLNNADLHDFEMLIRRQG